MIGAGVSPQSQTGRKVSSEDINMADADVAPRRQNAKENQPQDTSISGTVVPPRRQRGRKALPEDTNATDAGDQPQDIMPPPRQKRRKALPEINVTDTDDQPQDMMPPPPQKRRKALPEKINVTDTDEQQQDTQIPAVNVAPRRLTRQKTPQDVSNKAYVDAAFQLQKAEANQNQNTDISAANVVSRRGYDGSKPQKLNMAEADPAPRRKNYGISQSQDPDVAHENIAPPPLRRKLNRNRNPDTIAAAQRKVDEANRAWNTHTANADTTSRPGEGNNVHFEDIDMADPDVVPQHKNIKKSPTQNEASASQREKGNNAQSEDNGSSSQDKEAKDNQDNQPEDTTRTIDLDEGWEIRQNRPFTSIIPWLEIDWTVYEVPGVVYEGYRPKGKMVDFGGINTYQAGDDYGVKGVVVVSDVFGFTNQNLRIVDRLACMTKACVIMPDMFDGQPLPLSIHPPDTAAKKRIVREFFRTRADIDTGMAKLAAVVNDAKAKQIDVERWAIFGFGWGGKLATLAAGPNSAFEAAGVAHPGNIAQQDAEVLSIPVICLFSSEDGPPETVYEYAKAIIDSSEENVVDVYNTMHHGFMGARADLTTVEGLKAFNHGYTQLEGFLNKYLPDHPLTEVINEMFVWISDRSIRREPGQELLGYREDLELDYDRGLGDLNNH